MGEKKLEFSMFPFWGFGRFGQESCIIGCILGFRYFYDRPNSSQYKHNDTTTYIISKHTVVYLKFGPQQNYIAQIPNFQSPPLHLIIHAIP